MLTRVFPGLAKLFITTSLTEADERCVLSCTVVLYKCIPCSGMAGCVTINTCSISLLYCIATGMYEGVPGGVAGLGQGCCCV